MILRSIGIDNKFTIFYNPLSARFFICSIDFEQLGERVGIAKGTVSKILSEKDENGDPAYKELHIMWEIPDSKAQILKYGMTHLQNKQKGR